MQDIELLFLHELLDKSLFCLTEICSRLHKLHITVPNNNKQFIFVGQLRKDTHMVAVEVFQVTFFSIKTGSKCDLYLYFI